MALEFDAFEKNVWQKASGQSKKLNNKRCGCKLRVLERIDRNVLKWFWRVEVNGGRKVD